MPFLHRFLGNPVLSWLGRLFFGCPVGDFQCGLRGFRKDSIDRLELQTTGMEFSTEMVVKATLFNLRIIEIPTSFRLMAATARPIFEPGGTGGVTFASFCSTALAGCFFIRGWVLLLLGAAISVWLLPGPRTIGGVTFDYHTLLFGAMAILIGFQSVNFAVFTKTFAVTEHLVPEDPAADQSLSLLTLETGLIVGTALVLAGAATWIFGLSYWRNHHFGPLDPERTLRIVIPGFVSLTLGIEIVLSSFFISVLGMGRR